MLVYYQFAPSIHLQGTTDEPTSSAGDGFLDSFFKKHLVLIATLGAIGFEAVAICIFVVAALVLLVKLRKHGRRLRLRARACTDSSDEKDPALPNSQADNKLETSINFDGNTTSSASHTRYTDVDVNIKPNTYADTIEPNMYADIVEPNTYADIDVNVGPSTDPHIRQQENPCYGQCRALRNIYLAAPPRNTSCAEVGYVQ